MRILSQLSSDVAECTGEGLARRHYLGLTQRSQAIKGGLVCCLLNGKSYKQVVETKNGTEANLMNVHSTHEITVSEAVGMYRRLRKRGQNSTLARLSVEGRCRDLTPEQRSRLRELLKEYEAAST